MNRIISIVLLSLVFLAVSGQKNSGKARLFSQLEENMHNYAIDIVNARETTDLVCPTMEPISSPVR